MKRLKLEEMYQIIDYVYMAVFKDNMYLPEMYDITFRRCVLMYFTDMFNGDDIVPDDDILNYDFTQLAKEIDVEQLFVIKRVVDEKINFQKMKLANLKVISIPQLDYIFDFLNKLDIDTVNDKIANIDLENILKDVLTKYYNTMDMDNNNDIPEEIIE